MKCPREGCGGSLILDPEDDNLVCNQCARRFRKEDLQDLTAPGIVYNNLELENLAQLRLPEVPARPIGGASVIHQYYEDNKKVIISDYTKLVEAFGKSRGEQILRDRWGMTRATWKLKAEKRKVFKEGLFVRWGLQTFGEVVKDKPRRKPRPEKPVPMLFAGIEKTDDGKFSFICNTKEKITLKPQVNYRVVLADVDFDQNITINIGRLDKVES